VIVKVAQNAEERRCQWHRLEFNRGHVSESPARSGIGGRRCR
jgi:hypothetical protein